MQDYVSLLRTLYDKQIGITLAHSCCPPNEQLIDSNDLYGNYVEVDKNTDKS